MTLLAWGFSGSSTTRDDEKRGIPPICVNCLTMKKTSCCTPLSWLLLVLKSPITYASTSDSCCEHSVIVSMLPTCEKRRREAQRGRQRMKRWSAKDMMDGLR